MMTKVVTKDIEMSRVALDGGTQTRETLIDALALEEYVAAMERGDELPPIDVIDSGDRYYLVDGFHRYAAHAQLGRAVIRARVAMGTREDAVWYATRANATHGLRRTNADKRRAVRLALTHPRGARLSNALIARHCHVHDRLVASVREELEREGREHGGEDAPQKRIGADGRERPATIGRRRGADAQGGAAPAGARVEYDESGEHDDVSRLAPSVVDAQSPGGIAIGLLAPRAARMRSMLADLMREAAALRGAITRAEGRGGVPVVPRAVSSAWPIARALHAVARELDEIEPRGPCAACMGAGCDRCGQLGWVPVARGDR